MCTFVCRETTSETDDESVFVEVLYRINNQRRTFLTALHIFHNFHLKIFGEFVFEFFLDIPDCLVSYVFNLRPYIKI